LIGYFEVEPWNTSLVTSIHSMLYFSPSKCVINEMFDFVFNYKQSDCSPNLEKLDCPSHLMIVNNMTSDIKLTSTDD